MVIRLENIGLIRWAEFSPADLTVVCGDNNAGKSFATYAWFGFLDFFHRGFRLPIPDKLIPEFVNSGNVSVNVDKSLADLNEYVERASAEYSSEINRVFAAGVDSFKNSRFSVILEEDDVRVLRDFTSSFRNSGGEIVQISKKGAGDSLHFSWVGNGMNRDSSVSFRSLMAVIFSDVIKRVLFENVFPYVFITSAERTGAAVFRRDIMTSSIKVDGNLDKEKLKVSSLRYPLPVIKNVGFINNLDVTVKRHGLLSEKHPDIMDEFVRISGGSYDVDNETGLVLFSPSDSSGRFQMAHSASSVRALMDLYFYLKHIAAPGQLLIIDEPELNLHPSRQVAMGRFLCLLANYGLKIMVTTHSDYILREINNLLLLDSQKGKKAVSQILEKYKINKNCLINQGKVALFTAKRSLVSLPDARRRTKVNTLVKSYFDPEYGFVDNVFNDTLRTVSLLQQDITLANYEE